MHQPTTLYWFTSPNPQKARLALEALEIPHEVILLDLLKEEHKTDAFKALNPMLQVPVLADGDIVLAESNAIINWLGETRGRLWPKAPEARARALSWLFYEANHLGNLAGEYWFYRCFLPRIGEPIDEAAAAAAAARIVRPLQVLEEHLGKSQWMMGDAFTLVDCAIAPALDALDVGGFDMRPWPAAAGHLARMRALPAWARCDFRDAKGERP